MKGSVSIESLIFMTTKGFYRISCFHSYKTWKKYIAVIQFVTFVLNFSPEIKKIKSGPVIL